MNTSLLAEAQLLTDYWHPKVVGQINNQYVKVAKVNGELAWHQHENEDEMFLILEGTLRIEYQDRPDVTLNAGEFHIVPRNTMHNPVCEQDCYIALIEPATTQHTGDLVMEKTVPIGDQL